MDQIKIGKFIQENRKNKNLTQEQLAEKLNVSKNAVSKWERGLNLPDVSIMQDLCMILDISLNELFAGERISDENYKEVAEQNLMEALENSAFSINEKTAFYKKKWKKENLFRIILMCIFWLTLVVLLKLNGVEMYLASVIIGAAFALSYLLFHNQMMNYVESHIYKKVEKQPDKETEEC